jgi:PTS system ascorbate-specific IIC component
MSGALAAIGTYLKMPFLLAILGPGILLGGMMTIFPHMLQPYTERITGKKGMAVAHFSSIGFLMCAWIGKLFKVEANNDPDPKKGNGFLDDYIVATALSMSAIFLISTFLAERAYVEDITGGNFYLLFALEQGLIFTGGVYIVINGIRLIVQEIMPVFQQVAKRFVPNAIPALDVSVLFVYQRNRLLLGFVGAILGGIMAMMVLGTRGVWVIIPSSAVFFFSGAGAGLYGYSTGGKYGGFLAALFFGFALGVLPILTMRLLSELGFYRVVFSEFDFQILAGLAMGIKKIFLMLGFAG